MVIGTLPFLLYVHLRAWSSFDHFKSIFGANRGHWVNHNSDQDGAISSGSTLCSKVGIDILKQGGNAADAAIGAQFCLGVVSPDVTGLGGGGFALIRDRAGKYEFVDFREEAPAASTRDMYNNNISLSIFGGLASGVPGELKGLEYINRAHATMAWTELVKPAVKIARNGFVISQDLIDAIFSLDSHDFLTDDPAWAMDFAPRGKLLRKGDVLRRERYALTLDRIATNGSDAFYSGPVADAMVAALKADSGIMTHQDLSGYQAVIRKPLQIEYHGYRITSGGAPSGGPVVLNTLATISNYADIGVASEINISTHRFDEAIRFGYGARTKLGDPAFVSNVTRYEHAMVTSATGHEIFTHISDQHTLPVRAYNPDNIESLDDKGTSHLSVADRHGIAISLTSTVNDAFGSRLMVPETGVIMNNEMNDFSVPNQPTGYGYAPSAANYIEPGKRPLSSISPVIVEFATNRTLNMVTGAAGGSRIITAVLQSIWHVLDQKLSLREALCQPRFHDQLIPNQIIFEWPYNNQTTAFMQHRGHNVTWADTLLTDVNALVRLPNGTFEAVAEPRLIDSGGLAC